MQGTLAMGWARFPGDPAGRLIWIISHDREERALLSGWTWPWGVGPLIRCVHSSPREVRVWQRTWLERRFSKLLLTGNWGFSSRTSKLGQDSTCEIYYSVHKHIVPSLIEVGWSGKAWVRTGSYKTIDREQILENIEPPGNKWCSQSRVRNVIFLSK